MSWWIWIIAGIVLTVSEFVIPGFVVCFFGAGAIFTGLLLWLFPEISLTWQIAVFIAASLVFTLVGRRIFHGKRAGGIPDVDQDDFAGEIAVVTETISPDHPGKVEFRGSYWTAVADTGLAVGTTVRIIKRDNLTLTVTAQ